jgi:hypothetical protein
MYKKVQPMTITKVLDAIKEGRATRKTPSRARLSKTGDGTLR